MALSPLGSKMPARSGSPPTSAGFYRYPRTSIASPPLHMNRTADGVPTTLLLLEKNEKRDVKAEVRALAKVKAPVVRDFKYLHKLQLSPVSPRSKPVEEVGSTPSALLASFGNNSCYLGVDNRRNVEVQTEQPVMPRKQFADMKEYRNWANTNVDPFLKVLRKHLMTNKPEDLETFVIAYCLSRIKNENPPETVEVEEPLERHSSVSQLLQQRHRGNSVTTMNSLIKTAGRRKDKGSTKLEPINVELHTLQEINEGESPHWDLEEMKKRNVQQFDDVSDNMSEGSVSIMSDASLA